MIFQAAVCHAHKWLVESVLLPHLSAVLAPMSLQFWPSRQPPREIGLKGLYPRCSGFVAGGPARSGVQEPRSMKIPGVGVSANREAALFDTLANMHENDKS